MIALLGRFLLAARDLGDLVETVIILALLLGGSLVHLIKKFRGDVESPIDLEEDEAPTHPRGQRRREAVRLQRQPAPVITAERDGPPVPPPRVTRPRQSPSRSPIARSERPKPSRPSSEVVASRVRPGDRGSLSPQQPPAASTPAEGSSRNRLTLIRHPTLSTLRYAVIMGEVLGPPLSVKPRDVDRF